MPCARTVARLLSHCTSLGSARLTLQVTGQSAASLPSSQTPETVKTDPNENCASDRVDAGPHPACYGSSNTWRRILRRTKSQFVQSRQCVAAQTLRHDVAETVLVMKIMAGASDVVGI